MSIAWDPKLATGVREIDEQHVEIFRQARALLEAMQGSRGAEEIGKTVAFLRSYVVDHFGAEERLMRASRYPEMAQHVALHRGFAKDFEAAVSEYQRSGAAGLLAVKVTQLVGGWLRNHIGSTDRALGAFLQQRPAAGR